MITVTSKDELLALQGKTLEPSPWVEADQKKIDLFADATLDHQWIHTDPQRAAAESPFGGTIAHGYLTLSFCPYLLDQVLKIEGKMGVNYGIDKLRFLEPVVSGSRLRLVVTITAATEVKGRVKLDLHMDVEIEGKDKPAMAADVIYLFAF